jgi:hypothetical protein
MFRGLLLVCLATVPVFIIALWLIVDRDPDAQNCQVFRANLMAASSNWNSIELECTSPNCANHVKARWTEAGVKYIFSGFRDAKSLGGGVVMVHEMRSYHNGTGPALVTYVFMSDGSDTKAMVAEGGESIRGWADERAREFFYAAPANDGWPDVQPNPQARNHSEECPPSRNDCHFWRINR